MAIFYCYLDLILDTYYLNIKSRVDYENYVSHYLHNSFDIDSKILSNINLPSKAYGFINTKTGEFKLFEKNILDDINTNGDFFNKIISDYYFRLGKFKGIKITEKFNKTLGLEIIENEKDFILDDGNFLAMRNNEKRFIKNLNEKRILDEHGCHTSSFGKIKPKSISSIYLGKIKFEKSKDEDLSSDNYFRGKFDVFYKLGSLKNSDLSVMTLGVGNFYFSDNHNNFKKYVYAVWDTAINKVYCYFDNGAIKQIEHPCYAAWACDTFINDHYSDPKIADALILEDIQELQCASKNKVEWLEKFAKDADFSFDLKYYPKLLPYINERLNITKLKVEDKRANTEVKFDCEHMVKQMFRVYIYPDVDLKQFLEKNFIYTYTKKELLDSCILDLVSEYVLKKDVEINYVDNNDTKKPAIYVYLNEVKIGEIKDKEIPYFRSFKKAKKIWTYMDIFCGKYKKVYESYDNPDKWEMDRGKYENSWGELCFYFCRTKSIEQLAELHNESKYHAQYDMDDYEYEEDEETIADYVKSLFPKNKYEILTEKRNRECLKLDILYFGLTYGFKIHYGGTRKWIYLPIEIEKFDEADKLDISYYDKYGVRIKIKSKNDVKKYREIVKSTLKENAAKSKK